MSKNRIKAALAASLLTLSLGACASPAVTPVVEADRPAICNDVDLTNVGYSPYSNTGGYFPFVEQGLKEIFEECGITVTTSDPDADSGRQVSGIENLVAGGAGVVIVCPTDPLAISPVANRLQEQGVLVIGLATAIAEADITFNLDDYDFGLLEGRSAGEWLKANRSGEVPQVAILHQDSGGDPLLARHKGAIDGISEVLGEENWELVSEVEAFQEDTGNSQTSIILQANPELDLIIGLNDSSALGALSAIKASGRTPGVDVGVVTGGEDKRILDAVLAGEVHSTIGLFPVKQGRIIAEAILRYLSGDTGERERIVPVELVTAANAQQILDSIK